MSLLEANEKEEKLIYEWIHAMEVLEKYSREVRDTPQHGTVSFETVKLLTENRYKEIGELIKNFNRLVK